MSVQDTSLKAFFEIQKKLGYVQRQVMIAIQQHPGRTNNELADILDKPINRITPRVLELRKKGYVIDAGKKIDPVTRKLAHSWRLVPQLAFPPARPEQPEKPEEPEVNTQSKLFG